MITVHAQYLCRLKRAVYCNLARTKLTPYHRVHDINYFSAAHELFMATTRIIIII